MELGTRFHKQNRRGQEGATEADAFLEGSVAAGPDFQPASRFSVEGGQLREAPLGPPEGPSPSHELHVWTRQAAKFEPNWSDLARNLVTGPEAPAEACSVYNVLRTRIVDALRKNGWSTIAITSPTSRSGNTLTAINLAISLARDVNHTVLLVELDLVHPSFHRILGFGDRRGMSDYLLEDAALSELALDIGVDRLLVIPAGSSVPRSSELLASHKMAAFVEQIKRLHARQIVLFDLPSVLEVDDAMAFAPLADCALLVVQEDETRVDEVHRALSRLEGTRILGSVLNRSVSGTAAGARSE